MGNTAGLNHHNDEDRSFESDDNGCNNTSNNTNRELLDAAADAVETVDAAENDAATGEMDTDTDTEAAGYTSMPSTSSNDEIENDCYEGKGVSREQAEHLLREERKRCGSCLACTRERCQRCSLCLFGGTADDACIFLCCQNNTAKTKLSYGADIKKMLSCKDVLFSEGSLVHCKVKTKGVSCSTLEG